MRILSGIQPTGELHIGNWLGAVRNWVRLQDEHECLYAIVDYHAITVPYAANELPRLVEDMLVSLLAVGLDPGRCRIFLQSEVSEHTELAWILTTLAPLGQLQRMTQFKDKAEGEGERVNAGLLMYPVLQAADILVYKADRVPVGEDQIQHLELARTLARRFNHAFGEVFPEPAPLLTETKRVLGLDGESKMSKSRDNHIGILDDPDTVRLKMTTAFTDPQRKRRTDPGRPWLCNVFTWHGFFSDPEVVERVDRECRAAEIGCYEDKMLLADILIETLRPMRDRAAELRRHPEELRRVLDEGREAAGAIAGETMAEVRSAMGLWQASTRIPTA
ncbi:MAG: tryptophan--tRNA ligase [Gemmatimonadota bacterium]